MKRNKKVHTRSRIGRELGVLGSAPFLGNGKRGVAQRVVRVVLEGYAARRIPLGVLFGKALAGERAQLELLAFA